MYIPTLNENIRMVRSDFHIIPSHVAYKAVLQHYGHIQRSVDVTAYHILFGNPSLLSAGVMGTVLKSTGNFSSNFTFLPSSCLDFYNSVLRLRHECAQYEMFFSKQ